MEFIPLHSSPTYLNECADVLNEEWKRSTTARLHSLGKSKDTFPICMVLLDKGEGDKKMVVGSCRISDVQGQPLKSCLVESVVVKKSHRGKGYGRVIMQQTEEFAAGKGYKVMYLTTHDKQGFYTHLGYEFCSPVVSIASDILPDHLAKKLIGSLGLRGSEDTKLSRGDDSKSSNTNSALSAPLDGHIQTSNENSSTVTVSESVTQPASSVPVSHPAPPLSNYQPIKSVPVSSPAPPLNSHHPIKSVPVPPQAPPLSSHQPIKSVPVPPPAPPAPVIAQPSHSILVSKNSTIRDQGESSVRWDPSKVSWMKKFI